MQLPKDGYGQEGIVDLNCVPSMATISLRTEVGMRTIQTRMGKSSTDSDSSVGMEVDRRIIDTLDSNSFPGTMVNSRALQTRMVTLFTEAQTIYLNQTKKASQGWGQVRRHLRLEYGVFLLIHIIFQSNLPVHCTKYIYFLKRKEGLIVYSYLKGLSYEIDFEIVDEN